MTVDSFTLYDINMTAKYQFIATAQRELFALVADELRSFGIATLSESRQGIHFEGTLEQAYRACLWSRVANRIWLPLSEAEVSTAETLYEAVRNIEWLEHMAPDGTLAVDCHVHRSELQHSHYAALKTKDAIVDYFRDETGVRPSIETEHPDLRVRVDIVRNQAQIGIDLSGSGLHRRGYRKEGAAAPLRETLAAAILMRSEWEEIAAAGGNFVDPMCGSGTLLIEAALMAADIAPGLGREHFGFVGWRGHDGLIWDKLQAEAQERKLAGLRNMPAVYGFDVDGRTVDKAERNIERAGLAAYIQVKQRSLEDFKAIPDCSETGLVACNPPYGERLGERVNLVELYALLGRTLKTYFSGWQATIISGEKGLAQSLGLRAHKRNKVYNGTLACELLHFSLDQERKLRETRHHVVAQQVDEPLTDGEQSLANRLIKNIKSLKKWVGRNDIRAYRIYDKDIPEYGAAIDLYEDHIHVQEYAPPKTVHPQKAERRRQELLRATGRVMVERLNLDPKNIHFKTRQRQQGKSQYEASRKQGEFFEVREGGHRFLVNLDNYLDTGLFLDHRRTRALLEELAAGRDFLNLFAYTGSASVYAAKGGARSSMTVDMSNTYLEWAEENFALNGLSEKKHRLKRADCFEWLENATDTYDLIFLDPPTFSNSAKMQNTFAVERDYIPLLKKALALLRPEGILIFSTNKRGFQLESDHFKGFEVTDLSAQTIPEDFQRNQKIHRCYQFNHRAKKRIRL